MSPAHPAGPPAALALGAALLGCAALVGAPAASATASVTAGPTAGPTASASLAPTVAPTVAPRSGAPVEGLAPGDAGLEMVSMLPAELRPDGRVVLRGRVSGGATGLLAARVEVRRAAARVSSLSSLERWTAAVDPRPGAAAGEDFDDPAATARTEAVVEVGDVPADGSVPFTATLEADALGLRENERAAGAYGLQLLLLGEPAGPPAATGGGDDADVPVDDERGFLLWSPDIEMAPTRLSTTVELHGPPPLASTGLPDPAVLAEEVAPGGRLDRLLGAAAALDADWVVDPVLLGGLLAASDPAGAAAPGATPGGTGTDEQSQEETGDAVADPTAPSDAPAGGTGPTAATTGPAATGSDAPDAPAATGAAPTGPDGARPEQSDDRGADAAAWLDALADARDDREVVLTDWADPDPARLRAAADPGRARATIATAQAAALPEAAVEEVLGGGARDDVLVATRSGVSGPDLATLAAGRGSVLLGEAAVPLEDPFALTYTPDAVAEVVAGGERLTAVVSDEVLSADTAAALEGSPMALSRVLARLATTTLQRPSDPRLVSVALPAGLDADPQAAAQVAGALAGTGWAEAVPLSTALGTPPSDAARAALPTEQEPTVPGVQDMLDAIADARRVAGAVAAPEDPVARAALDLRAAAALSRTSAPTAPAALAEEVRAQTSGTVGAVQVVPGSRVTLVAAQAALPVTVVNGLDTEVQLVLEVRSRSPRLQVPETRVPVTVQPGQRAVVDVPVVAVASGRAEISSQLVTADGRAWGSPTAVTVTVATQAEGRVLTGVGVGVAVVFVLGAARAFVRNRRGRELVGAGPVEP